MQQLSPLKIESIESVRELSCNKSFPERTIIISGSVSEVELVELLKKNGFTYDRLGFKEWKISKNIVNVNALKLRKGVLWLTYILFTAIVFLLIFEFWNYWEKLEEFYNNKSLFVGIVTLLLQAVLGFFLQKKLKNAMHQYFYG